MHKRFIQNAACSNDAAICGCHALWLSAGEPATHYNKLICNHLGGCLTLAAAAAPPPVPHHRLALATIPFFSSSSSDDSKVAKLCNNNCESFIDLLNTGLAIESRTCNLE